MKNCDNCIHHSAAGAGPSWDRCHSPKARTGSLIRANTADDGGPPKCRDMRALFAPCGWLAWLFEPDDREDLMPVLCHKCGQDFDIGIHGLDDYWYCPECITLQNMEGE